MEAAIVVCRDQSKWFSHFQGCACQLPLRILANRVKVLHMWSCFKLVSS